MVSAQLYICMYYQVSTLYICADNQGNGNDNKRSSKNTDGQGQGSNNSDRQCGQGSSNDDKASDGHRCL